MPSASRLFKTTVLFISLHVNIVSPSPAPLYSHEPTTPAKPVLRALRVRQGIPPLIQQDGANNPAYNLPPVSDVFKMVADAESGRAPAVAPPAHAPAPMIAAALVPITTTQAPSRPTYYGPGLVVPTSTADPEADLPTNSAAPSAAPPTANDDALHKSPSPLSKLIVIGAVMAGLIALVFLVYVLLSRRMFVACSGKKKAQSDAWTPIHSPPPPPFNDAEKDVVYAPPWTQSSSSYSSQESQDSAAAPYTPYRGLVPSMPPQESPVIDIGPEYPRSKFSVTSSEYPYSILSSTRSSAPMVYPADGQHAESSPLLPSYEFFCLPSNPESLDDHHHSRAQSVPVFGHSASHDLPDVMVRSERHRRSRSVSGLAYTVRPSVQRESGSSAGDWRGSPRSEGWPSGF